jgi:glycosyltransferase involved in cell wall biosynthesis
MENFNFPEERIRIIYDPIKPVFKFVKKDRISDKPVVLMLGTGKHKNLNGLIEAVKGSNYHIDIVGYPTTEDLAKLDGYGISYKVYNKLTDQEVYERYIACDVLFFASFYEGFGMPIVEAQAVGRPVITSNLGAMKEVAKESAILVNPELPSDIRRAIDHVVSSRAIYDKIVEAGLANTVPYRHDIIANQYMDVYNEIAGATDCRVSKNNKGGNIVYLYSEVMPYAIAIMRELVKQFGMQVDCICWDKRKRTPFVPVNEEGITFHSYSAFNEDNIKTFIDERKPALIYVVGRMDDLYLKTALHFRHKYTTVTGSDNQWLNTSMQKVATLLSPWIYKRYFEYFWVPGQRQYEFARRMGYANTNIIRNLLTADTAYFGKVYDNNRVHKQTQYPHNIVFAGRFAVEKGLDVLVEAFEEAKKELDNDWKLILIGSGDMVFPQSENISVRGFMQGHELATESKQWGVFCLPSLREPWGVVIHEFTMAGLPILCSDSVGAADALVINNYNGFVFKTGDRNDLKKAIKTIMLKSDSELLEMGDRGYELSKMQSPTIAAYSLMSIVK